ncbi:uncharacterized protein LY79DRAFT_568646 [Colletotrichum navitas]|uniref:Uncharacterized protein n=1 Tax=Colletotrichum navitas TaxID=681940 RepID=A0AAD8PNC5_9PEZI|nr:uncharacterized protein LY79DRAFT_568646 [Colletotrichum navitas]KAK1573355.1 hypothetical protein LY79DRAFT_568646 [Colletotrichum navitas]
MVPPARLPCRTKRGTYLALSSLTATTLLECMLIFISILVFLAALLHSLATLFAAGVSSTGVDIAAAPHRLGDPSARSRTAVCMNACYNPRMTSLRIVMGCPVRPDSNTTCSFPIHRRLPMTMGTKRGRRGSSRPPRAIVPKLLYGSSSFHCNSAGHFGTFGTVTYGLWLTLLAFHCFIQACEVRYLIGFLLATFVCSIEQI